MNRQMTSASGPARDEQASAAAPLTSERFAALFERAEPTLWYVAAATVYDRHAADDVVQEAAVIALGKLEQFDPATNFQAWMARIVKLVALNHARRNSGRRSASSDPAALDHRVAAPTQQRPGVLDDRGHVKSEQSAFDDRVMRALQRLDDIPRTCLLLRSVQEMPYREIARVLDMPEGTAMSHVHRARMTLRELLLSEPSQAPAPGRRESASSVNGKRP